MDDEQLADRRAEIPVHCAACGGEFPGTTELHNGICDECQKLTHGPNYRLIAKLQVQEREIAQLRAALEKIAGYVITTRDPRDIARAALERSAE